MQQKRKMYKTAKFIMGTTDVKTGKGIREYVITDDNLTWAQAKKLRNADRSLSIVPMRT